LSKRCFAMCAALIRDNPGAYVASVVRALGRFMLAPNCRGTDWLPPRGALLARVWDVHEAAFIGAKLALFALAPLAFVRKIGSPLLRFLVAIVVVGALWQALLELGENARSSFPLQPWAACAVVVLGHRLLGLRRERAR